jgi:DNA-binding transcriptional LysR family regulator
MFDWQDARAFLAVAETGSTLAASRRLGISQTTAARRVAALEAALGLELFERRPQGYRLTAGGEALIPAATRLAEAAAAFADAAGAQSRSVGGSVRLTMIEVLALTVMVPVLRDLHDAFPAIRLELDASGERRDLAAGAADVAIRVGKTIAPSAGLVGRRIADDLWTVYCSRSYAAQHGHPRGRRALGGHAFIAGGEPGIADYYDEWLRANGLEDAVTLRHGSSAGLLAAVRGGLGLATLPCIVADQDPDLLRCLRPSSSDRAIWLLTHERVRDAPPVRAVIDFLAPRLTALGRHSRDLEW